MYSVVYIVAEYTPYVVHVVGVVVGIGIYESGCKKSLSILFATCWALLR